MNSIINLILRGHDDGASDTLRGVSGQVGGLGGALGAVGGAFAAVGTAVVAGAAAIGGGLVYSVGRAAEFEQAMANVGAISLASAGDLDLLRQAALDAGSTTAFTATQAADGLSFLAMAGFDVNQSIAALPAVLSAASAGGIDLATTADIVSNVLGGFRLEAEEAGRVSDVLALASANSNTSIEMLGQTMKFAAPTAANLGWSLEEVTAAAGFLADAGIQSSLAGTHLRAIMGSLATPTNVAAEAMEAMGLAVRDSEGNMLGLPDIIEQFETALSQLGPEQRDFALNAIFGREAAGSFSILLGRGSEALAEYEEKLQGAGGAAQEMADRQLDTLQGSMTLLKSAIDGVAVTVGSAFLPVLTDLARAAIPAVEAGMQRLQPLLDSLPGLFERVSEVVGGLFASLSSGQGMGESLAGLFTTIATAFGATEAQASTLYNGVVSLWEIVEPGVTFVTNLVSEFVSWEDVLMVLGLAVASVVVPALGSLLLAVAQIAIPIVAAIGAVALLRNAWENNWGGIQDKTQAVIDFVQPLIQNALAAIQTWWAENGESVKASAINAYEAIRSGIETAINVVQNIVNTVLTGIQTFWSEHGNSIITIATFIYESIKTGIETAINIVQTVVETVLTGLQAFWDAHGTAISESAGLAWEAIQTVVETVTDVIGSVIDAFAAAIEGDWYAFGENLREAWDTLWSGISSALDTWEQAIQNTVESIVNGIIGWFRDTDWGQVGSDIIAGIANGISSATGFIVDAAQAAAQAALDAAKGLLGIQSPSTRAAAEVGEPYTAGIALGAVTAIKGARQTIQDNLDILIKDVRLPPIKTDSSLVDAITGPRLGDDRGARLGISNPTLISQRPVASQPVVIHHTYYVTITDERSAALFLDYLDTVQSQDVAIR
ncbi:MAG: phage tail tape measure protein [Anaerolineae bacterium]|nr:phage tail tape measure protein [Anaerolineae bacterium]